MSLKRIFLALFFAACSQQVFCDNQTEDLSPIHSASSLPFKIDIELASFDLPQGIQSFVFAVYKNKCLCLTGRTAGVHGFESDDDNFPPSTENRNVYVINLETKKVSVRSLTDKKSGLSQKEIDYLSVTNAQFKQVNKTLYIVGGYGVDSSTGNFNTKPILSAINVPGLIKWVENPDKKGSAKQNIRQISSPIFQVAGGYMNQMTPHTPFLLVFGQNFDGFYFDGSNGTYTQQIRSFELIDDGINLSVFSEKYKQPQPSYRRRDLNVIPIIQRNGKSYEESLVALSGVFTLTSGIWTVPVFIDAYGNSYTFNPSKNSTFKQGMNNYDTASLGLYSKKADEMHMLLLGGISYETYADGVFSVDSEIPFTNNCTDIVIDKHGHMTQHLLNSEYPTILSTSVNPGNTLLFGADAHFVPLDHLSSFPNGVFSLDDLKERTLLGYVVGGIASTLPNTNTQADSTASSRIFKVYATPR
ncbi:MAG: hypothetical protein JSS09_08460 [Verrucomicrobia bacterium]|nr:hypothetical protein [Verrucomicrobiota bacterium]